MSDQRKDDLYDDELDQNTSKTELANKIAERSNRVAHTYQHIEDAVIRAIRWFSSLLNKILFSKKYAKITALVMAILLYFYVNYNSLSSVYTSPLKSTRRLDDVTVTAKYNSDTFELSGLVKTVDISIVGDANNVTNAITGGGVIVADLEGMTEGTHEVRLTSEGFGNNVDVICDPSTVIITLKKKTTQQFDLSYDFINLNQMESIYAVGEPTFEYSKVNVRASKDTLDSIAFVKALIDVSNKAAEFEQEARLIAYNASGEPVSADIIPSTVHVTVPVTSPSKTVPIEIQVIGEVPTEGMAIESIDCNQMTVTIYGPNNVLASVEKVYV
ncbi:MAG: hypothetical protein IKD69_11930, partial [Solobacterium sp.]|nr:hypothetical protein [Solobacterium sp.]